VQNLHLRERRCLERSQHAGLEGIDREQNRFNALEICDGMAPDVGLETRRVRTHALEIFYGNRKVCEDRGISHDI